MTRIRSVGRYTVEEQTIGKGNFAVVELATHTVTKTKVALKVIDKRKITKPYVKKNLAREARIMAQLRHPHIVRLYEVIVSPQLYCLVMEYVSGGDLLTFVRAQRGGRLKEGVARRYVRQLISALHHMHEHGIVHRDLKMENIMLDKKKGNIKIIDFGLSNQCDSDQLFSTHCGSPEYAAPELYVSGKDYGPEVDIWSLGVNVFGMVTGKLPFTTPYSENRRHHLLQQIRQGLNAVHDKDMEHLTDDCKDLLHGCIEPISADRLPLLDIEHHAWVTCEGQDPFAPYQPLSEDPQIREQVIDEMALRLKVDPAKIQGAVHEANLHVDDVSAIYNIMTDDYLSKRGEWDRDHTRQTAATRPRTGRRSSSRASGTRPDSAYTELVDGVRTPAVVSMVRPSLKPAERKSKKTVDFELDVVEKEEASPTDRDGAQSALPAPRANVKKNRPLANATTANRVIARTSYRKGTPCSPLAPYDHDHDHAQNNAHIELLHASTIHILVPNPSIESQTGSTPDVVEPPKDVRPKPRKKFLGGCNVTRAAGKVKASEAVATTARVSSTKEESCEVRPASNNNECISVDIKQSDDSHMEVKDVDQTTCLTNKQTNYHGYHTQETKISPQSEDIARPECSKVPENNNPLMFQKKGVRRVCVAHREFKASSRAGSTNRPTAASYTATRMCKSNKLELTAKQYPTASESSDVTKPTASSRSPSPTKRYTHRPKPDFHWRSGRLSADSTSTASSCTTISHRSVLHPAIASIHGKKETSAILSHIAALHSTDGGDGKKMTSTQRSVDSQRDAVRGKREKKTVQPKSPGALACRRTNMEFAAKDSQVKGQKFAMFSGMPQRSHKKSLRQSSPQPSKSSTHRHTRSTHVTVARVLKNDDSPSKFLLKFGTSRSLPSNKEGHKHCRVPTYGYSKESFRGRSPSPTRMRSPISKSTSPLRRVVDISEQAMSSLVNEAIREKREKEEPVEDIVRTVQRHFTNERARTQRPTSYGMYTRFVPVQTTKDEDAIRPSSSPAPRANATTETVFNILETLPRALPSQPASSSSTTPAATGNKSNELSVRGGPAIATKSCQRNAVSARNNRNRAVDEFREWDATYRLERKVSDTVKGGAFVNNLQNDQRTRAWVADMAAEYASSALKANQ